MTEQGKVRVELPYRVEGKGTKNECIIEPSGAKIYTANAGFMVHRLNDAYAAGLSRAEELVNKNVPGLIEECKAMEARGEDAAGHRSMIAALGLAAKAIHQEKSQ